MDSGSERRVELVIPPGALTFTVPGRVASGNDLRLKGRGGSYRPQEYNDYKDRVRAYAYAIVLRTKRRFTGYVGLHVIFWNTKLDITDNAKKAMCDAMNGLVWVDDRHVLRSFADKRRDKGEPRAEVTVYPIDGRDFGYNEHPPQKKVKE